MDRCCHYDSLGRLDQFLGLEEALEMAHLPEASEQENGGLRDRPPEHARVRRLGGLAETLFAILQAR